MFDDQRVGTMVVIAIARWDYHQTQRGVPPLEAESRELKLWPGISQAMLC